MVLPLKRFHRIKEENCSIKSKLMNRNWFMRFLGLMILLNTGKGFIKKNLFKLIFKL